MAITNPLTITWNGQAVGGSTDYQIDGPYVIERAYDRFLLVFDVLITASSYSDLKTKSDTIETKFSTRLGAGATLIISLDGNAWTYSSGTTIFNAEATVSKSGNPESDTGYSRVYTCKIEGEMPDETGGGTPREFEVLVSYDVTRRRTVTMRGAYYAKSDGTDGVARYQASFNAEATSYLNFVDSGAAWELVDEGFTIDRQPGVDDLPKPHTSNFSRQYTELLVNETTSTLDDSSIVDHRITFTNLSVFPVDSNEEAQRLQRVVCSYDCGVITTSKDLSALKGIYESKIKDLLKSKFEQEYSPQEFALEDSRVSFDTTNNRISAEHKYVFQSDGGGTVIEVAESCTVRESRTIDYTYTHSENEMEAIADPGFATIERLWNRTAIGIGTQTPSYRIGGSPAGDAIEKWDHETAGVEGPDRSGMDEVKDDGWNIISSTSQVTPQWMGMQDGSRIELVVLTESIVERYHEKEGGGGGGGPQSS